MRTPSGKQPDFTSRSPATRWAAAPRTTSSLTTRRFQRLHARLEKRGGDSYEIIDLGSTNGLDVRRHSRRAQQVCVPATRSASGKSIRARVPLTSRRPQASTRRRRPSTCARSPEVVLGRGCRRRRRDQPPAGLPCARAHRQRRTAASLSKTPAARGVPSSTATASSARPHRRRRHPPRRSVPAPGRRPAAGAARDDDLTLEAVDLRRVVANGTTILQDVSALDQSARVRRHRRAQRRRQVDPDHGAVRLPAGDAPATSSSTAPTSTRTSTPSATTSASCRRTTSSTASCSSTAPSATPPGCACRRTRRPSSASERVDEVLDELGLGARARRRSTAQRRSAQARLDRRRAADAARASSSSTRRPPASTRAPRRR